MLEVALHVTLHPDARHHRLGTQVARNGERHDLRQLHGFEAERQGRLRRLAGQALPPVARHQAPADFHRRSEVLVEVHILQADDADEAAVPAVLDHPLAESVLADVLVDAGRQGIALLAAHAGGEVPHHLGVGIEFGEGRQVVVAPGTQVQARGMQFDRGHGAYS